MAGHGGGAWKVAYADFVTAMMAFFLVMWIVAQNKPVREAVAEYFQEPFAASSHSSRATSSKPSNSPGSLSIRQRSKRSLRPPRGYAEPGDSPKRVRGPTAVKDEPRMLTVHDGKRSIVGSVVTFGGEAIDLDETAQKTLDKLLPEIVGKQNKIEIRGHSSGHPLPPTSPFADDWALCYARCQAVKKKLLAGGVAEPRVRLSQAADHEPATLSVDPEQQSRNSRVEVYMLGEMVDDLRGRSDERRQQLSPHGAETAEAQPADAKPAAPADH